MKIKELQQGKVYIIDLEANTKYHKACAKNAILWHFAQKDMIDDIKIFQRGTPISEKYMKDKERMARRENKIVFIITHRINLRPEFSVYFYNKIIFRLKDMTKFAYIDSVKNIIDAK